MNIFQIKDQINKAEEKTVIVIMCKKIIHIKQPQTNNKNNIRLSKACENSIPSKNKNKNSISNTNQIFYFLRE